MAEMGLGIANDQWSMVKEKVKGLAAQYGLVEEQSSARPE